MPGLDGILVEGAEMIDFGLVNDLRLAPVGCAI